MLESNKLYMDLSLELQTSSIINIFIMAVLEPKTRLLKNFLPAEKYLFCRWSWKYPGSLSEYNRTGKVTQPGILFINLYTTKGL